MAQDFKLNGVTYTRITRGDWADDPAGAGLDGTTARQRWIRHTWSTDVLGAAEFNALQALEGARVSLTTPNYDDRNGDYLTYYGASCQRVSAAHEGNVFMGVTAEFMVRL